MSLNAAEEMEQFYSRCLLCTCIPDVTPHLHIFSDAGKQLQLADKIKCLNIQIEAELPQNVCHSCMEKLEVTHELVTSSQQARIMLLQMKQQSEEVKQEDSDCSMTELDSYQPATDSAAIDNEVKENEIPMFNCSAEDFDQSHFALHCITEGTVEQTVFEEVLISKIEFGGHTIKLEVGEDPLDCLPQNSQCRDVEPSLENKLAENQVLVRNKLLECDFCCFYTNNKTLLATHMQTHLHTPNTSDSNMGRTYPTNEDRKFNLQCAYCGVRYCNPEMLAWHTENCHGSDAVVKVVKVRGKQHGYQCIFCATVCIEVGQIIRHLSSQHKIRKLPFHCTVCNRQFTTRVNLRVHQQSRYKSKTVSCSDHLLPNKNSAFDNHMKNSETSKRRIMKCKPCNKEFKSETLLKSHISKFHVIKRVHHKCLHCDETFSSFSQLKSHCLSEHPGKHILRCDLCDAEFFSNCGYLYHKRYVHGNQVFTCNICSSPFSSPQNLRDHTKSHHSIVKQTLPCKYCSKRFKCKQYLRHHIYVVHTGPLLHCHHCQYSARNRCNFVKHFKRFHLSKVTVIPQ